MQPNKNGWYWSNSNTLSRINKFDFVCYCTEEEHKILCLFIQFKTITTFDGRFLIESNCGICWNLNFGFPNFNSVYVDVDSVIFIFWKLIIQFYGFIKKAMPIVSSMWLLLKDKYFVNAVVTFSSILVTTK